MKHKTARYEVLTIRNTEVTNLLGFYAASTGRYQHSGGA
jgi:hypothetical protein